MPEPKEKAIVGKILRHLNSLPGSYARKMHGGPHSPGFPDVLACVNGVMFFFEVKRLGGRVTPLQCAELDKWRKAGCDSSVACSVEDVMARIESRQALTRRSE